jgi:hypothetical protein
MKVVVPDSTSEEDEICVCKRCGEVHDKKSARGMQCTPGGKTKYLI